VLPLWSGFHRWTPSQQSIFADTLVQITRDQERDTPTVLTVLDQLAALPAVPPTRLIELAGRGKAAPAVRDAALRALGRLDAGQGIPTLLQALGDTRARIAIYALRRTLLEMPEERALALLEGVPVDKVTVAKEVVRLIGELSSEAAYRALLEYDRRDLHRDVRVALLRALWGHLEKPDSWDILDRAAASPDFDVAVTASRVPADRLSNEAQRRLTGLIASLLQHSDPLVRMAALGRCQQLPIRDSERRLLPRLLVALSSSLPGEADAAVRAVFATYTGKEAHLIVAAVERVMPNRRALTSAIEGLRGSLRSRRRQLLPTARVVLSVLAADPLTARLRADLAVSALPWDELAEQLARMAATGELHAESLMTAVSGIKGAAFRTDGADLPRFETMLAASPDERLRRLALAALVAQAQGPGGWNEERLARLHSYRADPSPLVAAAAQFTMTP
jgi:hypothetical protein